MRASFAWTKNSARTITEDAPEAANIETGHNAALTHSQARVAKLVDAWDLKSQAKRRAGSIPASGTKVAAAEFHRKPVTALSSL